MLIVKIETASELVGVLSVSEREFKTGSRGYFGTGKIVVGGKKYQCQVQIVEIGSKPSGKNGREPEPDAVPEQA